MKQKSRKVLSKRYTLSNPKHAKPKVMFEAHGFSHNASKKRKFRQFRGKIERNLNNSNQADVLIKSLS